MSLLFYLSYAALWILVIVQGLLLLGVVRMVYQRQQPTATNERLRSGQEAPRFSTVDVTGAPIGSATFAGRLTALLFVSTACPTCMTTLEELAMLRHKALGNVVVICQAGRDSCARLAARYGLDVPIVADGDGKIGQLFGISGVPTAVLIDEANRVLFYGQPQRGEELEDLFARAPEAAVAGEGENGYAERAQPRMAGVEAE